MLIREVSHGSVDRQMSAPVSSRSGNCLNQSLRVSGDDEGTRHCTLRGVSVRPTPSLYESHRPGTHRRGNTPCVDELRLRCAHGWHLKTPNGPFLPLLVSSEADRNKGAEGSDMQQSKLSLSGVCCDQLDTNALQKKRTLTVAWKLVSHRLVHPAILYKLLFKAVVLYS